MKRYMQYLFLKLKRAITPNAASNPSLNMDSIIEENLQLMKEIRAKRMKFYKFNRIANEHLSAH